MVDERLRKIRLAAFMPVWGREALTAIALRHYKRLRKKTKCKFSLLVVGEDENSLACAVRCGHGVVVHENEPMAKKWQAALSELRESEPDVVMMIGSDDFATAKCIDSLAAKAVEFEGMSGLRDYLFFDIATRRATHWPGYTGHRTGEPVGPFRCFPRSLLDHLNWVVWGQTAHRALDSVATGAIDHHTSLRLDDVGTAMSFKGRHCLNGYDAMVGHELSMESKVRILRKFGLAALEVLLAGEI